MSNNEKDTPLGTLKLIYELIDEMIQLEKLFKNGSNKNQKGYLIYKNIFDGTKNVIFYEDLICSSSKIYQF